MLGFLAWEVATALLAALLAAAWARVLPRVGALTLLLALKLWINAQASQALAALPAPGGAGDRQVQFAVTLVVLLAASGWLGWRQRRALAAWAGGIGATADRVSLAALLGLAPLLAMSIGPIHEVDSLLNILFPYEWIANNRDPLFHAFDYPSFWEAGLLPGLVLGGTAGLTWWLGLQAVLLLLLALHDLARAAMPGRGLWLAGVTSASLGCAYLLFGPSASGVATIKNDMMNNAGILLALLVLIDIHAGRRVRFAHEALFGIAAAFMLVKYSGVPHLALAGMAGLILARLVGVSWLRIVRTMAVTLAVALAGPGIAYVKNVAAYGNPLYPFAFALPGGARLDGYFAGGRTEGSTIWENAGRAETWGYLLGLKTDPLPPLGPLLPLLVLAGFVLALVLIVQSLRQRRLTGLRLLAWASIPLWLLFARSTWSAGQHTNDLFFLKHFSTFRYALAAIGVSTVLVLASAAASRRRFVLPLVVGLCALDAAGRLAYGQQSAFGQLLAPYQAGPLLAALLAAGATVLALRWRWPGLGMVAVAGLLAASPALWRTNAAAHTRIYSAATLFLDRLEPTGIAVADGQTSLLPFWPAGYAYVAAGSPLRHCVLRLTLEQAIVEAWPVSTCTGAPPRLLALFKALHTGWFRPEEQAAAIRLLAPLGWQPLFVDRGAILLRRVSD